MASRFWRAMVATACVWVVGVSVPTLAATFARTNVSELDRGSEAVVHARVVAMQSAWDSTDTMIFTSVTLQVLRSLRGVADALVVVRVPGGTVDDFHVRMDGAPEFEVGQEVVVFLGRWDDGAPMVAGYFQGLSSVDRDALGNRVLRGGVADGQLLEAFERKLRRAAR